MFSSPKRESGLGRQCYEATCKALQLKKPPREQDRDGIILLQPLDSDPISYFIHRLLG
jgi:hypothetical protein